MEEGRDRRDKEFKTIEMKRTEQCGNRERNMESDEDIHSREVEDTRRERR